YQDGREVHRNQQTDGERRFEITAAAEHPSVVREPAENARSHDNEAIKSTYQRLDAPERNSPGCGCERNGFRNGGLLSWPDRHHATPPLLHQNFHVPLIPPTPPTAESVLRIALWNRGRHRRIEHYEPMIGLSKIYIAT